MFILARQRDLDPARSFEKYRAYLRENKAKFPVGAYDLASSEWWFDPADHRCPHDSWLERFEVVENSAGSRAENRSSDIIVTLLGAYQDLVLQLSYLNVVKVHLDGADVGTGHGDWRYDQFRVSDAGNVIHEIEWSSLGETANWKIEAKDVEFSSTPVASAV